MIEEDVAIARWGFAAMLVFASLMAAAFVCWLHEHGIRLSEPILKFLRRPVGEVLIVLVCVGGLVQHGATKGFFGGPRMMAPREMQTELVSAPESVDAVAGMFSSYTNVVTNVCATGIMPAETSVFLRAHWPWNLYPVPTGIEVYASPQLSTTQWVGVGTAPVIGSDNSAIIELPYSVLPDGWTSSMFFMLGLNIDTDQDGLSDSFERIISKTDPNLADTDGDGMPDGWEYNNGLNPLSDPTDDEANADADGDGISNIAEMGYGTDPQKRDSDGDGIDDLGELGSVRQLDDFVWYDTSVGVNILAAEVDSAIDDKVWTVDLHYPAVIGGKVYDRISIDSNALVYLIPSNGIAVTQSRYSYNSLPASSLAQTNIAVAVNWRDMNLNRQSGSQVRVAHVASNNCTVVEFVNLERRSYPSDRMTAQVVVPGGTDGTILVNYLSLTENLDGRSATVGLMDSSSRTYANINKFYALQWSYSRSGAIAPQMTLAYCVGTGTNPTENDTEGDGLSDDEEIFIAGTDPCLFDTDGDGLSDGDEVERRTNPLIVDTDSDGMPDGWEVANGFNPRVADGASDADSDGLSNLLEWQRGTDPRNPDTDGDGLIDSREVAWIDEGVESVPWFNVIPLKVVEATGEPSQALYDCDLPFTNWIAGGQITVAVADVNGVVYFGNSATTNGLSSSTGGYDLKNDSGKDCALVAGYWSNLRMRSALSSRIVFGTAQRDGKAYFVIQYENVGTYSGSASNKISFQVSICESTPDVVSVRYGNVIDDRNGYYLTIGAQGGEDDNWDNYPKLNRFYGSTSYPMLSGRTIVYHFGCGGDPHEADTDGDGLADAEEVSAGTNPRKEDSDGDGLDDSWEVEHGLDPLSAEGRDGAGGDFDHDGIENVREYDHKTNPASADTDDDGLSDGEEMGFITAGNAIPWLSLDESEDVTLPLLNEYRNTYSLNWTLPIPLRVQGELVTNLTLTSRGWLFFNKAGYANPGHSTGSNGIDYYVDKNTLALAVYGDGSLLVSTNLTDRSTSVRVGTATHQGVGYAVVECVNMYRDQPSYRTNSISWQVAVPTNVTEHVYVRYRDVTGEYVDGRYATVGMQSFGAKWMCGYCESGKGLVHEGLALDFHLGRNSNPNDGDTDGDRLSDLQEVALGTNLNSSDTDGDGMPDGWEVQYDFNPCVDADADGDADNDGVTNLEEGQHGSNPHSADTDGDGLSDGVEVGLGTSLTNADTDNDGLDDSYEYDAGLDPCHPDTDRDGLPDGWEVDHGLDPDCATGGDGTDGDPDNDGLSNIDEYQNGCDPQDPDTDGDGVNDGVEVGQGSDPTDASDQGVAPPAENFRELVFNINGDYAAWEITIEGQGPDDTRTQVITMGAPGATREVPKKLRKGNSYRLSMRWLNCDGHHDSQSPWYCWQALIDGLPRQCSFDHDYREGYCVRIPQCNNIVVGDGWIAENEDGLLTSHVHSSQKNSDGCSGAGNVAQGLVATLYVLDDPQIVPDLDGDGRINDVDDRLLAAGRPFRFWTNDDNDAASPNGDVARGSTDDFPVNGLDWNNGHVDGRRDFVDFTPILADVSPVVRNLSPAILKKLTFRLRHAEGAFNAVWTDLAPGQANAFQTSARSSGFGQELADAPQNAATERVKPSGTPLPADFAARARTAQGVFLVEGRQASTSPLWLEVVCDGRVVCSNKVETSLSCVEAMYRWLGLRYVCGDADVSGFTTGQPPNLPDVETTGPHYVFVHGYSVDAQSARGWAAEIFKRLWQSGSRSKFTAVDWFGNYSQFAGVSPNYYQNVVHAFATAPALKAACDALPGEKVMLAHSLGNMLVSEAITHCGLQYSKYYMLNAAVPVEAFNAEARAQDNMKPLAWQRYSDDLFACNWYDKFSTTDGRSVLTWRGIFAGIHNAVNCYSPTEDVLGNAPAVGAGGAWSAQELLKGTGTMYLLPRVRREGGWGFNPQHTMPLSQNNELLKTEYTDEEMVTSPPFLPFAEDWLHSTNAVTAAQVAEVRDRILADGIPAQTFAAGANAIDVFGDTGNYNYQGADNTPNGWPRKNGDVAVWEHSDIRNVAYYYVHVLFEKIKNLR